MFEWAINAWPRLFLVFAVVSKTSAGGAWALMLMIDGFSSLRTIRRS
jgi:hypothetical protein